MGPGMTAAGYPALTGRSPLDLLLPATFSTRHPLDAVKAKARVIIELAIEWGHSSAAGESGSRKSCRPNRRPTRSRLGPPGHDRPPIANSPVSTHWLFGALAPRTPDDHGLTRHFTIGCDANDRKPAGQGHAGAGSSRGWATTSKAMVYTLVALARISASVGVEPAARAAFERGCHSSWRRMP